MHIVVASNNPIKLDVAQRAFEKMFPQETLTFEALGVPSLVSDQPIGDTETRQGAENRAYGAKKLQPEADFYIGQEGGLVDEGVTYRSRPWICVLHKDGRMSCEHEASFSLPVPLSDLVRGGMELSHAVDAHFNLDKSGQKGGAIAHLTHDVIDRTVYYEQAAITALIPFI